jgi:lipid-binding SYLF domain-containing protein
VKGKFTLGADAAVAAGPVGREAGADTDIALKAEIYSYSRGRGLFAGISLEGSGLQIDDESNGNYYGKPGISAEDILDGKAPDTKESARIFIAELEKNASKK